MAVDVEAVKEIILDINPKGWPIPTFRENGNELEIIRKFDGRGTCTAVLIGTSLKMVRWTPEAIK